MLQGVVAHSLLNRLIIYQFWLRFLVHPNIVVADVANW